MTEWLHRPPPLPISSRCPVPSVRLKLAYALHQAQFLKKTSQSVDKWDYIFHFSTLNDWVGSIVASLRAYAPSALRWESPSLSGGAALIDSGQWLTSRLQPPRVSHKLRHNQLTGLTRTLPKKPQRRCFLQEKLNKLSEGKRCSTERPSSVRCWRFFISTFQHCCTACVCVYVCVSVCVCGCVYVSEWYSGW